MSDRTYLSETTVFKPAIRAFPHQGPVNGFDSVFVEEAEASSNLTSLRVARNWSAMASLSPFKVLLNNLSSELTQWNLDSLINVCGNDIPGGQRENIRTGWELFNILIHQNMIGEEPNQLRFLLTIIKEIRPKRRDLVSLVKSHIREHCEQPETILDDKESSWDGRITRSPSTPILVDDSYAVRCGCINCNCNPCCDGFCCCAILAVLFGFFAVVAVLLWYTNVFPKDDKKYLKKRDLDRFGPVAVAALGVISICCVVFGFYLRSRRRIRSEYSTLSRIDQSPCMSDRAVHGSYAASDSTRASYLAYSRYRSFSSGRMTASSSLASFSAPHAVTDGCSPHEVLSQQSQEDQNKEDNGSLDDHLSFSAEKDRGINQV